MQKISPSESVLQHILKRAKALTAEPDAFVCVFDLDSTLYDLTERKQQIMLSFLEQPDKKELYPSECELLKKIQIQKNEFGVTEALQRIGLSAQKGSQFYQELFAHWEFYFFHNDFIKYDRTYPGAVEYVQQLSQMGCPIIYLTGRDEPRMLKGTLESLKASGFPLEQKNIEVKLKAHQIFADHTFKLDYMMALEKKFKEIWLFENEPVNINIIEKHCPKMNFVFIDSNHSGREEVGSHHFTIKDFLY